MLVQNPATKTPSSFNKKRDLMNGTLDMNAFLVFNHSGYEDELVFDVKSDVFNWCVKTMATLISTSAIYWIHVTYTPKLAKLNFSISNKRCYFFFCECNHFPTCLNTELVVSRETLKILPDISTAKIRTHDPWIVSPALYHKTSAQPIYFLSKYNGRSMS